MKLPRLPEKGTRHDISPPNFCAPWGLCYYWRLVWKVPSYWEERGMGSLSASCSKSQSVNVWSG